MKNIFTLILFSFFGLSASAQLANWTPPHGTNFPTNLTGQINGICRINELVFHPTDTNKYYAVTPQGGLYLSTDQGANWTVAAGTENLTGYASSICIDRTNDQTILLGGGDFSYYNNGSGIYKSTNGGTSFSPTGLTSGIVGEILQHPTNALIFVASTNSGMVQSTDGGNTWAATTATNIPFSNLVIKPVTNSLTMYACTRETTPRFYRSFDFGTTWAQVTSGLGASTTFITNGSRIAVTAANPNIVYFEVIGGGGMMYRSTDGGTNFTLKKNEGQPFITFYDFDNNNGLGTQGHYNNCIWADQTDPSHIWLQSHCTWHSTDSGATWTRLTNWPFLVHTDMHQIVQAPFNNNKLYSCNDGGVWLSEDGGNTWTPKSNGMYSLEIGSNCGKSSKIRPDFTTIGTQDNGRLYGDSTAYFTIGGGDDYAKRVTDYNGNIYFDGDRRQLNHQGSTSLSFGLPTVNWNDIAFNRKNKNLAFIGENNVYRSTNLNAATPSWTQISTFNVAIRAVHSSIADSSKLYVLLNNGNIYVCNNALDAAPTFTLQTTPATASQTGSIVAMASNANHAYYCANDDIYETTNGGTVWTNITSNLPSVNHRRILAEEYGGTTGLVFVATNNAVYYRKTGAATWTNYSTNLPARRAPSDFSMFDDGTSQARIRYCSFGRGMWESPFSNLRELKAEIVVASDSTITCGSPTIQFADGSVGTNNTPITYAWSFPGGTPSSSSATQVNVTYPSNGTYTISLTVTDGLNNTSTKTISRFIQVINCAPDSVAGNAIVVNGGSNYVSIPPIAMGNTNTVTLSTWLKISSTQPAFSGIIFTSSGSACGLNFRNNNEIGYTFNNAASTYNYSGGPIIPTNEWTHVALVTTPTNATIYVNGESYVNNVGNASVDFSNSWTIGNDRANTSRTMTGELDEVCIYNRALSQSEIREQMHLTKNSTPSTTGLMAYYQSNEVSGSIVYDRAGTANGALQGTASSIKSTAPVGAGTSERQNVNTPSIYNFTTAGVTMTFTAPTTPQGEVCVTQINTLPDSLTTPNYNPASASKSYWAIHNYGSNQTFSPLSTITFAGYGTISATEASTPNIFKLYKRGSGAYLTSEWALNDTASAATSGATGVLTFDGNNITSYSQFNIQNDVQIPLAVELRSFTADCLADAIALNWQTLSEKNSAFFEIERSTDAKNWEAIGKQAAVGNSNATEYYTYVDQTAMRTELTYYRLRQVDAVNNTLYSNTINILCLKDAENDVYAYPVPITDVLNIRNKNKEEIKIYNAQGQIMYSGIDTKINTGSWASGVYILKTSTQSIQLLKE